MQILRLEFRVESGILASLELLEDERLDFSRGSVPGVLPAMAGNMAGARHFRELVCWQLAQELKLAVYSLVESPVIARDFKFREQLRDAAASAPRNIAEGFGRRTHREFARFLDVARASLMESQNHFQDALDRGYIESRELDALNSLAQRTSGAIARLQKYLRGNAQR